MELGNFEIEYYTNLSAEGLLTFCGFGIAILVFSVQSKLALITRSDHIRRDKLARCGGIYRFIKSIFNWGILYFVSGFAILFSSIFPESDKLLRPFLFNLSFFSATLATFVLTVLYIWLVLKEMLWDWFTAVEYDLI